MSVTQQSMQPVLATRLFVPGWWVRAYEVASSTVGSKKPALEQSKLMRLCPAMTSAELNALAVMLSTLQEQILCEDGVRISMDPEEFVKHATTLHPQKRFNFGRVFQTVPGLRLLFDRDDSLIGVPLFRSERWYEDENGKSQVAMQLDQLGTELVLGYTNPYFDLVRKAKGYETGQGLLGDHAPLSLWRSAWIELLGVEQALLLRIEKAMQWECCWLHFDGIFGKDLVDLFSELDDKLDAESERFLDDVGTCLDRLGKKLCHQGVIRFDVSDEYVAITEQEARGLLLVWQASQQKALSEEHELYRGRCLRLLTQRHSLPHMETLIDLLAASSGAQERWMRIFPDLIATCEERGLYEPIYGESTVAPLLSMFLFMEWSLRKEAGHPIPLAGDISNSEIGRLLDASDPREGLIGFHEALVASLDFRSGIKDIPLATIALLEDPSDQIDLLKGQRSRRSESVVAPSILENDKPSETERVSAAKLDSHSLKSIAARELTELMKQAPDEYQKLKQHYIDSLDGSRRKLLLDVRERMQPSMFDQHLKHSLVRYMIENPSVWKGGGRESPMLV